MGVIYVITNSVNGKKYAGKTLATAQHRWGQHKAAARKGNQYFYRAIRKHGIENFTIEVVDSADTHEELLAKEMEWIKRLNTCDRRFGYNGTLGGESGVPTPETLEKMRGRPCSPETRRKISEAQKGRKLGEEQLRFLRARAAELKGKPLSDERRAAMRANPPGLGSKRTLEQKERQRKSMIASWTPERRASHSAMRKAACAANPRPAPVVTPEGRARVATAKKAWWAAMTPEERSAKGRPNMAKALAVALLPESVKRRTESIRTAWTPEKRAAWAEQMRPRLVAQAARANAAAVESKRLRRESLSPLAKEFAGIVSAVKRRRTEIRRGQTAPFPVVRLLEVA